MRVLLQVKMLKETKTQETIVFSVTFLSLVAFQRGGLGPFGPPLWLRLCLRVQRFKLCISCYAITHCRLSLHIFRQPGLIPDYDT